MNKLRDSGIYEKLDSGGGSKPLETLTEGGGLDLKNLLRGSFSP